MHIYIYIYIYMYEHVGGSALLSGDASKPSNTAN